MKVRREGGHFMLVMFVALLTLLAVRYLESFKGIL